MPWTRGGKRTKALSRLSSYKKRTAKARTSKAYGIRSNSIHRILKSSLY